MDSHKLQHLAKLARIGIAQEELSTIGGEMKRVLEWVQALEQIDTRSVAPMLSPAIHALPRREDKVGSHGQRQAVLQNAPQTDSETHFFAVPKVME